MWRSERGFGLLEILIAITIFAFISLGVVSITDNAILTKERTTMINKNNLQIETAMSRFEMDFLQIYSPLYFSTALNMSQLAGTDTNFAFNGGYDPNNPNGNLPNANGTARPAPPNPLLQAYYEQMNQRFQVNEHFSGLSKDGMMVPRFLSPDRAIFEFFTSSNRRKVENVKQSHFSWVRYSLADQDTPEDAPESMPKGLKSLVRYVNADDPYDDKKINIEDEEKVKGAVLLQNVEKLEFQFWNPTRKAWETNIKTVPQGENALRGVKISITWYDLSGQKRTAEKIFRTLWPMTVINDPAPTPGGASAGNTTAGGSGGNTAGSSNGGNTNGGSNDN